jgi:polyhydroxybutyrate depolymerase
MGTERTFWTAPPLHDAGRDSGPLPLLIALHGLNSSGSRLAWWSGLDRAGPAAGFHCVFPDARNTVWDDHGCGRRDGADDAEFIARLVTHVTSTGAADPERVFITGVSSGATFAERLVRTHAVTVSGVALIMGTARVASTTSTPVAQPGIDVLLVAGTEDPIVPYEGGPPRGPLAAPTMKRVGEVLVDPSGHDAVAPEVLAREWAAANACPGPPTVEPIGNTAEGFQIDRLQWPAPSDHGPAVTLYRVSGGGHGWPDGRQYLPKRYLGTIPQGWDATGLVLAFAQASNARAVRASCGE